MTRTCAQKRSARPRRPLSPGQSAFVHKSRSCYIAKETTFWKRKHRRQQRVRHQLELEHPHRKQRRHHHQSLGNRHQGLEHYRKKLAYLLSGLTPAISPGDAHSTTAGVAPDVPHHETASTRSNLSVDETSNNKHAQGASGTTPPTTCVYGFHLHR